MKRFIERHGDEWCKDDDLLRSYVEDRGLVWWPERWTYNAKDVWCLSWTELKCLEIALLDSDSTKYSAEATFCRYVDSLKPGSTFLPLECLRSWKPQPVELDGAYIPYQDQVEAQMDKLDFSVYDTDLLDDVCKVLPDRWNSSRKRRCVMAIAAAREGLRYRWDMDRYPLRFPFRSLETALYQAAQREHAEYLRLATEFNRQAPLPVLCYRKKNTYTVQALWQ